MGCHTYTAWSGRSHDEVYIRIAEESEQPCLCTFPHNYGASELVDAELVRSMAFLGAAVAIAANGEWKNGEYVYLPSDLPAWVVDGIERCIPVPQGVDE